MSRWKNDRLGLGLGLGLSCAEVLELVLLALNHGCPVEVLRRFELMICCSAIVGRDLLGPQADYFGEVGVRVLPE